MRACSFPESVRAITPAHYVANHRTAAIFDATPASFRALFLAEWLEWYTALRADENWGTLVTALHVSAVAELGGPVAQFELQAAVRLCLRYERWIKTGVVDDIVLPTAAAHFSYRVSGKALSLSLEVGKRSLHAGDYLLLEEIETRRAGFTGPTGHVKQTEDRKVHEAQLSARWNRPPPAMLAMDPEALERLEGRAGVISTLGALLDIALAMRELADAPEMSAWELFSSAPGQVATWSVLQGVESTTQILQAARRAHGAAPLSGRALVWAPRIGGAGVAFVRPCRARRTPTPPPWATCRPAPRSNPWPGPRSRS